MTRDLSRLLRPNSVAVIGGGAWCASVITQLQKAGYTGDIWPVHPKGGLMGEIGVYSSLNALPSPPDATFVGINRDATIDVVQELSNMGAGGAVCFASGFAEVTDGTDRNAALLRAAGDMPILGPNCYGFINALDGALLWPDQHGCVPVDSGVAILTQSSNIAINLTMQNRALPVAYMITCGNQAQTHQAQIAMSLLDDPRVTAIGLHVEGFRDIPAWQAFAREAAARNIPVVVLKVGKSDQAQEAAVTHTASLAGSDAGAQALINRFGFARVDDLEVFLETLKILHLAGPLPRGHIATISCSGGEASLAADIAQGTDLTFPPLNDTQTNALSNALGPRVALGNPLDYHTYIWRDTSAMTDAFSAMIDPVLDLTILIVDFPRDDICDASDWDCAVAAAIAAKARTGGQVAMCATLPELMPEAVARHLAAHGVVPLSGLRSGLHAANAAIARQPRDLDLGLPEPAAAKDAQVLDEAQSKAILATHGVIAPQSQVVADPRDSKVPFPVVLKGIGFAHKSEHGAVILNLPDMSALQAAAQQMKADSFLVEQMVQGGVAELLLGVTLDPAHGYLLTIGAGGTLTELLEDTGHLLLPTSADSVKQCLMERKVAKLLTRYRGQPAADIDAIVMAVLALQDYVLANAGAVQEVEVNPLICTPTAAIAADALIRIAHD